MVPLLHHGLDARSGKHAPYSITMDYDWQEGDHLGSTPAMLVPGSLARVNEAGYVRVVHIAYNMGILLNRRAGRADGALATLLC